jgi:hypothetical protein
LERVRTVKGGAGEGISLVSSGMILPKKYTALHPEFEKEEK